VTEELKGGEHGKTPVLELVELTLLEFGRFEGRLARVEVAEVSVLKGGQEGKQQEGQNTPAVQPIVQARSDHW